MSSPVLTEGNIKQLLDSIADKGRSAAESGEASRFDYFDGLLHAQELVATMWRAAKTMHSGGDDDSPH